MDLIETLDILADAVNQLAELAQEQAHIIEQYQMVERCVSAEQQRRLAMLDDKLMYLGHCARSRKGEKGGGADGRPFD